MSTTLKTLNEGFTKRYLKEAQPAKESSFTDPSRLFVKIDLNDLSEDEAGYYINRASDLLETMLFKSELLEDNLDGTYSIAFPGYEDFKKLLAIKLNKLRIPYEISEDGQFLN